MSNDNTVLRTLGTQSTQRKIIIIILGNGDVREKGEILHQGKDIVVFLTKYADNELNAVALTDSI